MTTQLKLYNGALRLIGERSLASTSEDSEPRHVIDEVYDDVVAYCLAQGIWNFALRRTAETQDGSGLFGYTYIFTKPTDFIHLYSISTAADHLTQLTDFIDAAGSWHANTDPLQIHYTSNGATFGGDLTLWPQAFAFYVEAVLAGMIAYRLAPNPDIARMIGEIEAARYANALAIYGLHELHGQKPFNVEARNPPDSDAPFGAERVLPFGRTVALSVPQARQKEPE